MSNAFLLIGTGAGNCSEDATLIDVCKSHAEAETSLKSFVQAMYGGLWEEHLLFADVGGEYDYSPFENLPWDMHILYPKVVNFWNYSFIRDDGSISQDLNWQILEVRL
jgi:hypothetical protein